MDSPGGFVPNATTDGSSGLFPLFPVASGASLPSSSADPHQWLQSPSFTFDVSALPPSSSTAPNPVLFACSSSDDEPPSRPAPAAPAYDLVASGSSEEDQLRSRREEKRKRKKRRRERGREGKGDGRKSGVRAWAGSELKPAAKNYYFDVRGDRDNLAFGSLYRMDVARYKRIDFLDLSDFQLLYQWRLSNLANDLDSDVDALDSKLRVGGRYCSVKYSMLERHKGFKRVKISHKKVPLIISGDFIPLDEVEGSAKDGTDGSFAKGEIEESWEDEVIRSTREFNRSSRDFPHDENIWLAYAEFQDKIASTQPQKAARLQTLEKKISILEKAVDLNPENEELLLCLLKAYGGRDSTDVLMGRWEKILMQHSDSCKLWKEFLLLRQGEFSWFKVSDMRKTYAFAIQALSSACSKLRRQDNENELFKSTDPALVQLELGLVDIFISLCRFEWQSGHQELATGLFQAEIEFSCFCPSLFLSSYSKLRLFEHFWTSNCPRIGEDEALGWSTWLAREEQNRQNTLAEENSQETELGGWTGWVDRSIKVDAIQEPEPSAEHAVGDPNNEENLEAEDIAPKDDIETLLKKLGINVDSDPHSEVKDAKTWNRWSAEELSRDCEQWMPVHEYPGDCGKSSSPHSDDSPEEGNNGELSRVILFEDVNEYLFSLCSVEARVSLVSQFIDFYGGKISQWTCSNSSSWIGKMHSLETVPHAILEDIGVVLGSTDALINMSRYISSHLSLDFLTGRTNDLVRKTNMMKFLRNSILLCLDIFPRNRMLEEAVLSAEDLYVTQMKSSTSSVNPSRALAKSLLKADRQDLLLCGVYARIEATYGNIELARKVFDMALSSTDGLPLELLENVPLLYFWYAEMEMANSTSGGSAGSPSQRAIHILSCLGSNVKYSPYKSQTSGLQILRARQGFKDQVQGLRSSWARGDIKEPSIALVCSASLFEVLTAGCSAGIEVIEQAFSMSLPERRSRSLQLECLWMDYIGLLRKHLKQLKFSKVWESISRGLQIYPFNPESFIAFVEVSHLFTVPSKTRRIFDECGQSNPSILAWLFAFLFELTKTGSQHRIHGIFERALANEKMQKSVLLWRCYLAYEVDLAHNPSAAKRVFFRAIHACPWSKRLWLDGFQKLSSILSAKELSDLQEVMRDKELNLRTDIYEILLQDEMEP